MKIACLLYPNFTSADLINPITVWQFVPGVQFEFIAAEKGPVATDTGLSFNATHSFADASPTPDVVFVPGGAKPTFDALGDPALLDTIARLSQNAGWVTSVCTGSLLLGAAGLLNGYRAACHWYPREWLRKFGATPSDARVVVDRNRATGGGVTSGMDFALHMVGMWGGEASGRLIELMIEYAPEPPFGTGRPELADAATLSTARQFMAAEFSETVVDRAAQRLTASPRAATA
ncbi:DJ-1/PfpI family protein [Nevskia sp.]|uniref:DJ-1/PfpI family protein n=1 Tax=Nevskia sp. TaxID=1929292 RepID=UPI0025D1F5C2|nr:DJ-1/PfpI family protein [Nevskia sp.]